MGYPAYPPAPGGVRVLPERSEAELRRALARAVPELAASPIALTEGIEPTDPVWCRGSARVGDAHVVKFAWRVEAAPRLWFEGAVMRALAASPAAALLPPLRHVGADPLLVVTRVVPGVPLRAELLGGLAEPDALHESLARALASIHDPATLRAVAAAGVRLPAPVAQADTARLRPRLSSLLAPADRRLAARWCDWVDRVQRTRPPHAGAAVHGDLHGHNVLVAPDGRVAGLLDWEGLAEGDLHHDLRYLPAQAPPESLLIPVITRYEALTGRAVELDRVIAWHVLTVLGDALWRTAAGVPLPDGGTVDQWVTALRARIGQLGQWRPLSAPTG